MVLSDCQYIEHCVVIFQVKNTTYQCLMFIFYIISFSHSCCSEPRVVGLINIVIIVTYLSWGLSLLSRMSALFQNYEKYGLLYVRVINTHV